jgi:hypothetical protein
MKSITSILLVLCGTACVGLGFLGMFLPILPTTPFLLLAAACYARSSRSFYRWLLANRWCGEYIENYRTGKGIALRHKVCAIALLWPTMGYSMWIVMPRWWLALLLAAIAIGVTIHLVTIRTAAPR